MSLFKVIGKVASVIPGLGPVARIAGAVGAAIGATRKAKPTQLPLPGIGGPVGSGAATAGLPAVIKRTLPTVGRVGGAVAAGVATGVAIDALTGQPIRKKSRRMNPCNERALKRALRRIEQYDKVRKRVDASLRKACPPTRRRTTRSKSC